MRILPVLTAVLLFSACRPAGESSLPTPGTKFLDPSTGTYYRVTWSGKTTYNLGACPEVGTLCVHLIHDVANPQAAELAVTLDEFTAKYDAVRP